jgi:hypothetical protein
LRELLLKNCQAFCMHMHAFVCAER